MSSYSVPSGHGYMEIPLDSAEKLKSVQVYQMEESLNVNLEFDDDSRLELIFSVGFQTSAQLLKCHEGDYRVAKTIKPKRS